MSSRSPISIICGHVKLFINEPALLPEVLAALPRAPAGEANPQVIGALAVASARIVDATCAADPSLKVKGLRDVLWHHRHRLPRGLVKQLQGLNDAYSYLRHTAEADIGALADTVVRLIAEQSSDSIQGSFVQGPIIADSINEGSIFEGSFIEGSFEGSTIEGSPTQGNIEGSIEVGSIVGCIEGNIEGSIIKGSIEGNIEGSLKGGSIEGSISEGNTIEGNFAGSIFKGSIEGSISEGSIIGGSSHEGPTIEGSTSVGSTTEGSFHIEGSIKVGSIVGIAESPIVGNIEGSIIKGSIEGSLIEGSISEVNISECSIEGSIIEGSIIEGSTIEGSTIEGSIIEGSICEGNIEGPIFEGSVEGSIISTLAAEHFSFAIPFFVDTKVENDCEKLLDFQASHNFLPFAARRTKHTEKRRRGRRNSLAAHRLSLCLFDEPSYLDHCLIVNDAPVEAEATVPLPISEVCSGVAEASCSCDLCDFCSGPLDQEYFMDFDDATFHCAACHAHCRGQCMPCCHFVTPNPAAANQPASSSWPSACT
jgi:hypothetical protein